MKKEDAIKFFSDFYGGEHHFPSKVNSNGFGWMINDHRNGFSTYDGSKLTKLVIMAHERSIRVELNPIRNGIMKISIWQRTREGNIMERHPTIEDAISSFKSK